MKMDMKRCFTGHALAHSLTGLGVGIILIQFVPSLNTLLVGVAALVVGVAWDMMGK